MRIRAAVVLALTIAVSGAIPLAPVNATSCAPDPDALTLRQMVVQGRTGVPDRPYLLLGRVIEVRDHMGPGGPAVARLRVWASPAGHTGTYVRVRFQIDKPNGPVVPGEMNYRKGKRYAVVAHRLDDRSFVDDAPCGATRLLGLVKFKHLLRLARS